SIGVANAAAAAATTTMVPAGGDEVSAAAVADGQFQVLAEPVQTLGQAWLASPAGELLDPLVNAPFESLTGRELIGNGAAGVAGVDGGAGQAG
ncbi:PE domain-containing protein, partial [Mycobacterium ulcerans]|nr:PE domain-containing protein [Mycobacterium ulcerans]MEB3911388.1 PE domain-containing protein [Mycobacterium ulcerans]MEB3921625.1 PE domain-containing protein [Mycobacterium ulcerans]MEB3934033.1 PE domain-containing protein [Mycobacterium ulcerans]MEB4000617.1 PE domain-containing protein [Mycobacterium ulcerans]